MSSILREMAPVINSFTFKEPSNAYTKALEFINETPNMMLISLSGQFGQFYIQPYTTRFRNLPGFGNGGGTVTIIATMQGSGQAPLSLFGIVSYGNEDPEKSDFVITSDRLNSLGNAGSVQTATGSVVNDNNLTGTTVVEATKSGSTGNNLLMTNDGLVQFAEYVAGIFTKLFQVNPGAATAILIGAAGRAVENLGNEKIDGTLAVTGTSTLTGAVSAPGGITGNLVGVASSASSAGSVAATGVTAGALPASVTLTSVPSSAASVPATGVTAGALPSGVTLPSSQITGTITASAIAAANVTAGSLPSSVILTSVAANANLAAQANFLLQGANVQYGQLGKSANADLIDGGPNGTVYYKCPPDGSGNGTTIVQSSGTGKVTLQNATGPVNVLVADGNNGVYIGSGKIGKNVAGDMLDASGGSGTPIYIKNPNPGGGGLVFQSPGGAGQWSRAKEGHGIASAPANGTVTVTHGMGKTPDNIQVTPSNGSSGTQTFSLWNVGATTFQIYSASNACNYYWKAENY